MAISTNSIIHYTDSFEKLKSIVIEGFAIKYCEERLFIDKINTSFAAHPMISFCDIPLSHSSRHFDAYGKYGIGLSKVWANKLGINPVLYLDSETSISKTLGSLLKERRNKKSNLTIDQRSNILRIKCFAKNYSGHLKRLNIDNQNYRFYDEREWRFVPEKNDLSGAKFSIHLKDYLRNKDRYNSSLSKLRFTFKASDINYIIVEKTSEIPKLIKIIRQHFAKKYSKPELDLLLSKICSTTQIIDDY